MRETLTKLILSYINVYFFTKYRIEKSLFF